MLLFGKNKQPKEPLYEYVTASDLSVEELKRSSLPDSYLLYVLVTFASKKGNHYRAEHVPHGGAPCISLDGLDGLAKDEADFKGVEEIIAKLTGGNLGGKIHCNLGYLHDEIALSKEKLTQSKIADFVEGYTQHFTNVAIIKAVYMYVPKPACENSNLPQEKITLGRLLNSQPSPIR